VTFADSALRMYTATSVRQRLRIVAMVAALAVSGVPAAALACQWVCATQTSHSHHHAAVPRDMAMAGHSTDDGPSILAGEAACDHAVTTTLGIASGAVKLLSLDAIPVVSVAIAVPVVSLRNLGPSTAHSPPGSRVLLTALRI
jgi:hypothetical protein